MALTPKQLAVAFRSQYPEAGEPKLYRAPGRVNLIGEHTDYNLGYVFPIALEMACYVAIAPANHGELRLFSRDFAETSGGTDAIKVSDVPSAQRKGLWSDYVVGVAQQLTMLDVELRAADLLITSEVPVGSGLSSSAALEVSTAFALLLGRPLAPLEIAVLSQRAEGQFVGMPCGIMDQYTSVFGRAGEAVQIDCRSLTHEYVELPPDVAVIATNSMVKHELGSSAYRERVAECAEAVEAIQQSHPEVHSLRDVSPALFQQVESSIPAIPRKRARHIVGDTQRVLDLAAASRARDLAEMGKLFVASHRSMQYDYEISCEEIDFLVDEAIRIPGVYGSRMTGGGFGGCTVSLVKPDAVSDFEERITKAYLDRHGLKPLFYRCEPSAGAGPLT